MGAIKERLKIVALYKDDKRQMENQLEYAGLAIESELQKLEAHIEALEKEVRGHHLQLYEVENKQISHTDKAKPRFQVGDTIALRGLNCGDIRIVLGVNPNNSLRLMSVPGGNIQPECHSEQYGLVYRPENQKSEIRDVQR